jgi:hypothetical protein
MGEMRNSYKIFVKNTKGNKEHGKARKDDSIILTWILKKQGIRK